MGSQVTGGLEILFHHCYTHPNPSISQGYPWFWGYRSLFNPFQPIETNHLMTPSLPGSPQESCVIWSIAGRPWSHRYTWWFRNPVKAPVEVGSFSHYLRGFYTSQVVVWDFWSINSRFGHHWMDNIIPLTKLNGNCHVYLLRIELCSKKPFVNPILINHIMRVPNWTLAWHTC